MDRVSVTAATCKAGRGLGPRMGHSTSVSSAAAPNVPCAEKGTRRGPGALGEATCRPQPAPRSSPQGCSQGDRATTPSPGAWACSANAQGTRGECTQVSRATGGEGGREPRPPGPLS